MSKWIEIDPSKKQDDRPRIDLDGLCESNDLRWFSYQECANCRKHVTFCQCEKDKKDHKVVYFCHESHLDTGVKFYKKRDMAEQVLLFDSHRMSPRYRDASWVAWAGNRGLRILTTMNEADRAEVQKRKAALAAMKEASASGEMVNVEAGVAPMSTISVV
jgi:hypothetical protein